MISVDEETGLLGCKVTSATFRDLEAKNRTWNILLLFWFVFVFIFAPTQYFIVYPFHSGPVAKPRISGLAEVEGAERN